MCAFVGFHGSVVRSVVCMYKHTWLCLVFGSVVLFCVDVYSFFVSSCVLWLIAIMLELHLVFFVCFVL